MILDNEAAYVALLYKERDQWKAKHDTLAYVARGCIAAVEQERDEACARARDATQMLCEAVGAEDSDWNIGQAATRATEVITDLKLTCDRDHARIIAATKNIAAALEGMDHLGLDLEWAVDLVLTELKTLTDEAVKRG